MRTGQAFQVTFGSCHGISPTIHQESERPDKLKMLSGSSCNYCGQLGVSMGCTAPDSGKNTLCFYVSDRETLNLAQCVVPQFLQLVSQPGKAAATAGAHQSDPVFAADTTSLGIMPTLPRSSFKLSPFLLQRPGPNQALVGWGHN